MGWTPLHNVPACGKQSVFSEEFLDCHRLDEPNHHRSPIANQKIESLNQ